MLDNEPLTLSKEKDVFEDRIVLALILGFVCLLQRRNNIIWNWNLFFQLTFFEDFTIFVAYHGWCLCAYSDILQGKSSYNSSHAWSLEQSFHFLTSSLLFLHTLFMENKCLVSKSCLCWFLHKCHTTELSRTCRDAWKVNKDNFASISFMQLNKNGRHEL